MLGQLLLHHQSNPLLPAIRIDELYRRIQMPKDESERLVFNDHLDELKNFDLVKTAENSLRVNDKVGDQYVDICLTAPGLFYSVSHAHTFSEQKYGLTWDMPGEYADHTFAIAQRFGAADVSIPASDRLVDLKDNQQGLMEVNNKLDQIVSKLQADNELGAQNPFERDDLVNNVKRLIAALKEPKVRANAIFYLGFTALVTLAQKFADKPLGYLADETWAALKTLIGL
ncbi:MAG: hypothetical protein ACI9V0_003475 [Parasphingorhabdus sp.]|jgi:hypothetical protein